MPRECGSWRGSASCHSPPGLPSLPPALSADTECSPQAHRPASCWEELQRDGESWTRPSAQLAFRANVTSNKSASSIPEALYGLLRFSILAERAVSSLLSLPAQTRGFLPRLNSRAKFLYFRLTPLILLCAGVEIREGARQGSGAASSSEARKKPKGEGFLQAAHA
ncbi:hypothetical protein MHYP_G00285830 [Metynnis hypsauchen]